MWIWLLCYKALSKHAVGLRGNNAMFWYPESTVSVLLLITLHTCDLKPMLRQRKMSLQSEESNYPPFQTGAVADSTRRKKQTREPFFLISSNNHYFKVT